MAGRRPGHGGLHQHGEGVVGARRQWHHGEVGPGPGRRPVCTVAADDDHHRTAGSPHGGHRCDGVLLGEGQVQVDPRQLDVAHGLGGPAHDPVRVVVDHEQLRSGLPGPTYHPTRHVGLVLHGHAARRGDSTAHIGTGTRVDQDAYRPRCRPVVHGWDRTGRHYGPKNGTQVGSIR